MSRLSADAMLQGMADALPTHEKGDEGSDIASSYEVVALLVHSYVAAIGFRLCGFDEDKTLPEAASLAPRLPPQWNNGFGSLGFAYRHKQSSMKFIFRVDRMGTKVQIRGLGVGDERIYSFETPVREVVNNSNLPFRIPMTDEGEDRSSLPNKLRSLFVSDSAITTILAALKVQIVQKLIPKLQSEGYVEEVEEQAAMRSQHLEHESRDPDYPFPNRPRADEPFPRPNPMPDMARPHPLPIGDFPPPDFDDEYEILRPPRRPPYTNPYNIGGDDLHPPGLGPRDPLSRSMDPYAPLRPGAPPSGMHPTFDDPLFTGQGGRGRVDPSNRFDPQAPPGARWDPLGPGGNPRFPGPGPGQGGNFGPFGPGGGDII